MEELPADVAAFVETHLVDRRNSNAVKWDGLAGEFGRTDLLPMWIADTEFKAPQAVIDALTARIQEGTFGYSIRPQSYYDAFIDWEKTRHGVTVQPEWMRFGVGVVKSLYAMVNWLTEPGDPVLIMQPVYYPFMNAIKDLGRKVVSVDLQLTADGWRIDFDQLEKTLATQNIKAMIFARHIIRSAEFGPVKNWNGFLRSRVTMMSRWYLMRFTAIWKLVGQNSPLLCK
ncbi:PLP-dependent beta-cystathionase/maltose regulon repressor [Lacticaseibacillus paracasei]|nr:PLP-dependent beta-cystathionase/maltose regulon repressor [Lacticaseibacillus paracasei]